MPYYNPIRSAIHTSYLSEQKLPVILGLFAKPHKKAHGKKSKMPLANIYFVFGCSKPAAMVSRAPKSNVVTSLFFTMKSAIFKKG